MNSASAGARPRGEAVIFQGWRVKELWMYFLTLTLWRSFLNHWTVAIKVRRESRRSPFLELNSELGFFSRWALTCATSWMDLWRSAEISALFVGFFSSLTGKVFFTLLKKIIPPLWQKSPLFETGNLCKVLLALAEYIFSLREKMILKSKCHPC